MSRFPSRFLPRRSGPDPGLGEVFPVGPYPMASRYPPMADLELIRRMTEEEEPWYWPDVSEGWGWDLMRNRGRGFHGSRDPASGWARMMRRMHAYRVMHEDPERAFRRVPRGLDVYGGSGPVFREAGPLMTGPFGWEEPLP